MLRRQSSEFLELTKVASERINLSMPLLAADDTCFTQTVGSRYGISHVKRRRMIQKAEVLLHRLIDYQVLKGKMAEFTEQEITNLCKLANDTFLSSPSCLMIDLESPIYIIGDIFAQYSDLMRIFLQLGWPPQKRYLFLGNYVNRNSRSVETIALLLLLKVRFPNHVFLLRGCHETEPITRTYGLMDECIKRFDVRLWRELTNCFCHMPAAAIIDGSIFCVHSGLSPIILNNSKLERQEDLYNFINKNINRPVEAFRCVILRHFLWSDPDIELNGWDQNSNGLGYLFGANVVREFCQRFQFQRIIRANEMSLKGYSYFPGEPKLLTIFTAPNYYGAFKNSGALVLIRKLRDGQTRTTIKVVKPIMKLRGKMTARMNISIEDVKQAEPSAFHSFSDGQCSPVSEDMTDGQEEFSSDHE